MASPRRRPALLGYCAGALVALLGARPAPAQCAIQVLPGPGTAGVDNRVWASAMWDPDGAGPLQARVVIGGDFTMVGTVQANRVAVRDPVTGDWLPLGSGMNSTVLALVGLPNGDLVAGGWFTTAGGVPAMYLARWDGTAWSPIAGTLSSGFLDGVKALAVLPNGNLVAGGSFQDPINAITSLMQWNGSTWQAIGGGPISGLQDVEALAVLPNGDLAVGGTASNGAGYTAFVARWDGTSWSMLGSGMDGRVKALAVLPNGNLAAGGQFFNAGGVAANHVAVWNGTAWAALGTGFNDDVRSLAVLPSGDLVAGGEFTRAGGVTVNQVARWNGSVWSALATGITPWHPSLLYLDTLTALPNGDLVAGGYFAAAGAAQASNLARWDGTAWSVFVSGTDSDVDAIAILANGDLVVGGKFTSIAGVAANHVARWNGSAWSTLGAGTDGRVAALCVMPNGDLVAAGAFTAAGGVSAGNIARWNGSAWSALGAGVGGGGVGGSWASALTLLPNGDLVVGGQFTTAGATPATNVARWDGAAWSALGTGLGGTAPPFYVGEVAALVTLGNGEVAAGGSFFMAGSQPIGRVARWNGTTWSTLGANFAGGSTSLDTRVAALVKLPNGELLAGGKVADPFPGGPLVERWNGTAWTTLSGLVNSTPFPGASSVTSILVLPAGDLAVGGGSLTRTGGAATNSLLRWDGAAWSDLATGLSHSIAALGLDAAGRLRAGGHFISIGGVTSAYFATLTSSCPAAVVGYGAGCHGTGGLLQLSPASLPWVGSTWRSLATGIPPSALALSLLGLSTASVPLPTILPQGGSGCSMLVTPDVALVFVPTAPSATTRFAIPDALPLVGMILHHQVGLCELDAFGNVVACTSTNALTATLGVF